MAEESEILKGMTAYLTKKGYVPSEAHQITLAKTTTKYICVVLGSGTKSVSTPAGPDKKSCQITIYRLGSNPEICEINVTYPSGSGDRAPAGNYLRTYFSGETYEYIIVELCPDGGTYLFERVK